MSTRAWRLTEWVVKSVVLTGCGCVILAWRFDTPSGHDATTLILAALSGLATGKIVVPAGMKSKGDE